MEQAFSTPVFMYLMTTLVAAGNVRGLFLGVRKTDTAEVEGDYYVGICDGMAKLNPRVKAECQDPRSIGYGCSDQPLQVITSN